MIRTLLFVVLLMAPFLVRAQCDSVPVNRAVKAVEEQIWSDYPKAIALARSVVEGFRGKGAVCEARALLAMAKTMWTNGDYAESIGTLRDASRLAIQAGDKETLARCYNVIANNYYYQAYYDSAEKNFIRSRDVFHALGNRKGLIEISHDMALMYHRRGNYAESLKALLESERLKPLEPEFVHFVGDFSRGNKYFIDTAYYKSTIAKERALLRSFRASGNIPGIYQSLINISIAYHEMSEYRRAGYYAAIGSGIMKDFGSYPFWYFAAKEYGLAGMKDSCLYFHKRAFEELPRATQIKIAITYQQLGNSYLGFQQPDSALVYFVKALHLNEKMNNRITIPDLHLSIAKAFRKKGDFERAEEHLLTGIRLSQGVSIEHANSLYAFGQDLYKELGNTALALQFAVRHAKLEDSISRNEGAMTMIRFQAQFETERKEQELMEAHLKVRNRTIILLSLAFVTALSLAFMVTLYVQRQKIKRQNLKLHESNAEQKALMQEVHHRVKNNLQYIVSLLSLQSQTVNNAELIRQIEQIKTRIVTIGIIHQRLYQSQGVQAVELSSFLQELIKNMLNALPTRVTVKTYLSIDPIRVDVETAISLGLIVNELVTNSVKYAFVNHPAPELQLSIARQGDELVVHMSDNGPGFTLTGTPGEGFGIRLIELLLRKLKGTLVQVNPNTLQMRITGFVVA